MPRSILGLRPARGYPAPPPRCAARDAALRPCCPARAGPLGKQVFSYQDAVEEFTKCAVLCCATLCCVGVVRPRARFCITCLPALLPPAGIPPWPCSSWLIPATGWPPAGTPRPPCPRCPWTHRHAGAAGRSGQRLGAPLPPPCMTTPAAAAALPPPCRASTSSSRLAAGRACAGRLRRLSPGAAALQVSSRRLSAAVD